MAISTGGMNQAMGYYDPKNDMYEYEKRRVMQQMENVLMNQQMIALSGLAGNQLGLQNAVQPVPNPEPNKVLLLLE